MHKKKDNRGSAMIIIIVVIAFVSILISTLYAMVTMNIQMKSVDRKAKKSFYSAEGALEQINLGLQKEMSDASKKAYAEVMQSYSANVLEASRRMKFNTRLIGDMQDALKDATLDTYKIDKLVSYLTTDVAANTVISSSSGCNMEKSSDNSSLVLKGVVITYTDTEGFQSVIETDIRVNAPNLNLIQPSDMPDVFEYSMVANKKLQGTGATVVDIFNNVYAGSGDATPGSVTEGIGIQLQPGDNWNFENAGRIVTKGSIEVPLTAKIKTGSNTDLWAAELKVKQGTVDAEGRTYVADDLILEGEGSKVTLGGAYYGYGNGTTLNNDGTPVGVDGNSSAILINGTKSTLDMTNLRRLLLSGSAQIATGKVDTGYVLGGSNVITADNDSGLSATLKYNYSFATAIYQITSVKLNKLWCSNESYNIVARTDVNNGQGWEQFQLINNSDGTISFKDNHGNRYLSVQLDDYRLNASASTIGPNEKFTLGSVEKDGAAKYVLRAYVNEKFITVDPTTGQLYANRDKVTDEEQLFTFLKTGSSPQVADVDPPVITWMATDYGNKVDIRIGTKEWLQTKNPSAKFYYRYNWLSTFEEVTMSVPGADKYYAYCTLENPGNVAEYYFVYNTSSGEVQTPTYPVVINTGAGNVGGSGKAGTTSAPKLADGVYSIYAPSMDANNCYLCTEGNSGNPCYFNRGAVGTGNGSYERIVLVNNSDGTISLWSKITQKYASVQTSGNYTGCIVMNGDSIGATEKFTLEYSGETPYYRLKYGDKYLYINTQRSYNPIMVSESSNLAWDQSPYARLQFNWLEYSPLATEEEEGSVSEPSVAKETPTYGMTYETEDKAKASFKLSDNVSYTLSSAKMLYSIDGAEDIEVNMSINAGVASATISGLNHGTKVNYMIVYTCSDSVTKHVPRSIYIHERRHGASVAIPQTNQNVNLGESIEVKSNQIAYLVPAECIGVNNGETLFGQNPMSGEDYARLMAYGDDDVNYPDFEVVSFTKKIKGLNKTLDDYRTPGTDGYQVVFSQLPGGSTMVYFYVDFDSNNASKYFEEYYKANQDYMSSYMNNYVANIKMSTYFTRLMLNGNMFQSENTTPGSKINIYTNEGYGANLDSAQQASLQDEETSYMKRYNALTTKLILDYGELTPSEKTKDLFGNIIRDDAFTGISTTVGNVYSTSYGSETIYALVINNEGNSTYVYDGTGIQQNMCLILASGDVEVQADFSGIIIAKGTITLRSGVQKIQSNKERLRKILQAKVNEADPSSDTIVKHFFVNGESYVLEEVNSAGLGDNEYADYATCVSYENWTKR